MLDFLSLVGFKGNLSVLGTCSLFQGGLSKLDWGSVVSWDEKGLCTGTDHVGVGTLGGHIVYFSLPRCPCRLAQG